MVTSSLEALDGKKQIILKLKVETLSATPPGHLTRADLLQISSRTFGLIGTRIEADKEIEAEGTNSVMTGETEAGTEVGVEATPGYKLYTVWRTDPKFIVTTTKTLDTISTGQSMALLSILSPLRVSAVITSTGVTIQTTVITMIMRMVLISISPVTITSIQEALVAIIISSVRPTMSKGTGSTTMTAMTATPSPLRRIIRRDRSGPQPAVVMSASGHCGGCLEATAMMVTRHSGRATTSW